MHSEVEDYQILLCALLICPGAESSSAQDLIRKHATRDVLLTNRQSLGMQSPGSTMYSGFTTAVR